MIKGVAETENGRRVIIVGLSALNMEKLLDNKPIKFSGESIGLTEPIDVVIIGGKTEEDIMEDLRAIGVAR